MSRQKFGLFQVLRRSVAAAAVVLTLAAYSRADDAAALRLTPFPKEVRLEKGDFSLDAPLTLEAPADRLSVIQGLLDAEFRRAGLPRPEARSIAEKRPLVRLVVRDGRAMEDVALRAKGTDEDYVLRVATGGALVVGRGSAGLLHGVQTLVQLLRANRRGNRLPCLTISDWPALRWRCFQNDMTRGPSAKLATLERQVGLGALLKMNLFTYYMEHQYAFAKHSEIGPPDGSLRPDELRGLVAHARPLGVEILGNQQSFGHMGHILKHERFAALRENESVLTPVREETYQLLDDLYAEVCPIVPFPFFNVCCDETWGLGSGPARELSQKIGVGGVYVRHIRRVRDLLATKHQKRMMMWGDIILKHPEHIKDLPRDAILLTWGYAARDSFADQIEPFAQSGFEFFVCPGVRDWNVILPEFGDALVNIRNFVRDGVKHGALGMLNTEWKDDGETLNGPNWHGYAWGAECAWNASATEPADFNRRLGAVLFGEQGDHFGQAITLLAQTHRLFGAQGLRTQRFWETDALTQRSAGLIRRQAEELLALVRPAIEHLEACRRQATVNADLLDGLLFGARRMEVMATRGLNALEVARLYRAAYDGSPREAGPLLEQAEQLVRRDRAVHADLGRRFSALWLAENKPFSLDRVMARYAATDAWCEKLAQRLADARGKAQAGQTLPAPEDINLAEGPLLRRVRAHAIHAEPLDPTLAWEEPSASHRFAVVVDAGVTARTELPVEIDVALPAALSARPIRAFCSVGKGAAREMLAQLDRAETPGKSRLTLVVPGPLPKGGRAVTRVYLGLAQAPAPLPGTVSTRDAEQGRKWIENDKVRLLLGPEGGHVYRWEVKALSNRDVTMPGETGWQGFSDVSPEHRATSHALICTAHGPALVRYCCTDERGLAKTVSLFGGAAWMEVILNEPVSRYWDFDRPANFAADGSTPGKYLFSNGQTGPVGRQADGVPAQVRVRGARWGVKFNTERLALGLATPEAAATHVIAPGAGAGGVGVEGLPPAAHFVTFAGLLDGAPQTQMDSLCRTLDFRNPPIVTLYALQARADCRK